MTQIMYIPLICIETFQYMHIYIIAIYMHDMSGKFADTYV